MPLNFCLLGQEMREGALSFALLAKVGRGVTFSKKAWDKFNTSGQRGLGSPGENISAVFSYLCICSGSSGQSCRLWDSPSGSAPLLPLHHVYGAEEV